MVPDEADVVGDAATEAEASVPTHAEVQPQRGLARVQNNATGSSIVVHLETLERTSLPV